MLVQDTATVQQLFLKRIISHVRNCFILFSQLFMCLKLCNPAEVGAKTALLPLGPLNDTPMYDHGYSLNFISSRCARPHFQLYSIPAGSLLFFSL